MFIINMMIPITMVGFGKYFVKHAPKQINAVFGYRTARSMKNKDTWEYAHHYCGKLWIFIGWIILAISIIGMIMILGKERDFIGVYGSIICGIQTVVLIASIFPTEAALKRTFDENGHRSK